MSVPIIYQMEIIYDRRSKSVADIVVSKDGRVICGMGIQIGDDLWIKNETVFVKIPYDYDVAYIKKDDFLICVQEYELTSLPNIGDIVKWFSGDRFFFVDRVVEDILFDDALGEILVVSAFGVRQPVSLKSSAVFVRKFT